MADLSVKISEIELNLRKLIALKNQLVEKNSELVRQNDELRSNLESLQTENAELKDKLNKTTIVNALGNEKEIENSRQLIKALVKEIDQCVAILNAEQS
jgi:predicted nuclease with TOPRIM domain